MNTKKPIKKRFGTAALLVIAFGLIIGVSVHAYWVGRADAYWNISVARGMQVRVSGLVPAAPASAVPSTAPSTAPPTSAETEETEAGEQEEAGEEKELDEVEANPSSENETETEGEVDDENGAEGNDGIGTEDAENLDEDSEKPDYNPDTVTEPGGEGLEPEAFDAAEPAEKLVQAE